MSELPERPASNQPRTPRPHRPMGGPDWFAMMAGLVAAAVLLSVAYLLFTLQ